MPADKSIVSRLFAPLLYLNLAAMLGGAAWLVSLNQDGPLWMPFIAALFSFFIIPVFSIPAGIFSHLMTVFRAAGRKSGERAMMFCSVGYLIVLIAAWCALMFWYVTHAIAPFAIRAGLLWAAGVSISPLLWWSSTDKTNVFVTVMVEAAEIGVCALCALQLEMPRLITLWEGFAVMACVVTVLTAGRMAYEEKFLKKPDAAGV